MSSVRVPEWIIIAVEVWSLSHNKREYIRKPSTLDDKWMVRCCPLSQICRACILHNLRSRYLVLQIYTYSGLFCICINPYKWLNVYTQIMRDFYRNKRRNEAPPHLYAIADGALQFLELGELHRIIITMYICFYFVLFLLVFVSLLHFTCG